MAQKQFKATLIRGEVYFIGDVRAERGKTVVVTEEQKDHLEEHAVDTLSTSDANEIIQRQKFNFEEIEQPGVSADEDEDGEGDGHDGAEQSGSDTPAERHRPRKRTR